MSAAYQEKETEQSNRETLNKLRNQYNILQRILVEADAKLTIRNDRIAKDAQFHLGRIQA